MLFLTGATRRPAVVLGLLSLLALLASAPAIFAADVSWNGSHDTVWGTKQNWSTNNVPTSTDNALFNTAFANQPSLGSTAATVGGLWMATGVGQNVTIGGTAALTLASNTINGTAGLGILVNNASAYTLTINCPVALGATQTWTNSSSNVLTIGAVNLGAFALTVNGTGSTTISGVVSGAGSITKSGSSTLILSGTNTYTGLTSVSSGILNIRNASALGTTAGGTIVNIGAALQIQNGIAIGAEQLTLNGSGISNDGALRNVSGTNSWSGGVTLGSASTIASDAGTLTLSGTINNGGFMLTTMGAGSITLSGIISGSGGLTKNGAGTLTLSGIDTYSGGTTVNAGTLQLSVANQLLITGGITIAGGMLDLQTFNQSVGAITLTSGTISSSTGILSGSSFGLQSGTVSAVLAGTGSVTKSTLGTVTLSGVNTYTGATTVSAGTLQINTNGALGTTLNGTTVSSGAALKLNGVNYSTTEALTLNGSGISGAGALTNSGTSTFAGAINIATNATISPSGGTLNLTGGISKNGTTLTFAGGGIVNIMTNGITGSSPNSDLVVDGTTVVLDTANSYNGPTTVQNSGTLKLGASNVMPSSPQTDLTVNTSSVFDLASYSDGVASLTGDSTAIVKNSVASTTSILTVNPSGGSTTFAGVIAGTNSGAQGDISLVKNGAGTLALTGLNTFSGTTTINAGTLTAADTSGSALGSTASITINSGGTLLLGAINQINNSATMTLAGGTFSKGSYSEGAASAVGIGALILTASGSHLDFGTGMVGVLCFASFTPNSNTLIIDNWIGTVGTVGSASTDRLIFASDQSSNLSDFSFTNFSGAQEIALGSGFYEIVPLMATPEPSTYLGGVIALVALGYHERRLLLRFLSNKDARKQQRPRPAGSV
jgi:fibronectin-binding autotransporter adhesin